MRFLLGLLGGAVCAAITILIMLVVSAITGNGAPYPYSLELLASVIILGAALGGVYTSFFCGRIATGPAIGVGFIYGVGIWLILQFLVLPLLAANISAAVRPGTLAAYSIIFGVLMGFWVIISSHIWPNIAVRCE
ncbi:MAG: hypothetical protein Q7N50_13195 [Armatimonadota bacterium]|nr:hypothetical protein [Armatimonadota bacterium]